MDNQRAQTLEALQTFIQNQKALLNRTRADIEKLQQLQRDIYDEPDIVVSDLTDRLNDSAFRLSESLENKLDVTKTISWGVFDSHDPTPLHALALKARQAYVQRNEPHTKQRSELSDLQKLVKQARKVIIDPVLASIGEPELDPFELKKELERAKIRELKKRKIHASGLSLPSSYNGNSGVFIRHDVEDESMEVDISLDDDSTPNPTSIPIIDDPPTPSHPTLASTSHINASKGSRTRKPTVKLKLSRTKEAIPDKPPAPPRKKSKKGDTKGASSDTEFADASAPPEPAAQGKPAKPKPETYKQAWSVSEQHLLEQLLEQIPAGEKFRWQKISRAMGGRRTPRQVASRVQKYFEKLKRFGVGPS
ncbi:hypothetical protein BDQ17DRAFT_1400354 [Cyathus striatus]|nr:hypothetical protein BDQ17DRAFT_1400354 [Cyathus striatus]